MKVLGIYHSADLDGKCSGAIIAKWAKENDHELILHGMDYGQETPWELIKEVSTVIVSDFSLPMDTYAIIDNMEKNLLWYDHHKSAIKDYEESPLYGTVGGIREIDYAGCELTWQGLFPYDSTPPVVSMLGAYDCWRWVKLKPDDQEQILNLQYGMRLDAHNPDDPMWAILLEGQMPYTYMGYGKSVRKYQAQTMERINATGRLLCWEGFTWYTVNTHNCSSTDYESHVATMRETIEIDGVLVFYRGQDGWKYSLRSFTTDLDVSLVAKKYGGGGHKGAAGFNTNNLLKELL